METKTEEQKTSVLDFERKRSSDVIELIVSEIPDCALLLSISPEFAACTDDTPFTSVDLSRPNVERIC